MKIEILFTNGSRIRTELESIRASDRGIVWQESKGFNSLKFVNMNHVLAIVSIEKESNGQTSPDPVGPMD